MRCTFKRCTFISPKSVAWSTHDWPATDIENSSFEFENCLFLRNNANINGDIRFSSTDSVGRLDNVKIIGCVFRTIFFDTEWNTDLKQGYKVETMLCKSYTVVYSSHILENDRIAPTDYLALT
jgi:hypothetical protein